MKKRMLPEAEERDRARTFKRSHKARRQTVRDRIRELWPVVRLLRREGYSWRKLPAYFQEFYGFRPGLPHTAFVVVAREMGDVGTGRASAEE